MKFFLLILISAVSLDAAGQGQTQCSPSEVLLTNRGTCAARCTANVNTCGGNGTCAALPGGGKGITNCTCSSGYINSPSGALCIPDCTLVESCNLAGGSCDAPGICNCATPGTYFTNKQCVPNALCNGDCYGKICTATACQCAAGFYALHNGTTCQPTCQGECLASKGLKCVDPQVCTCSNPDFHINAKGICSMVIFVTTTPAGGATPATTTPAGGATPATTTPAGGATTKATTTPAVTTPAGGATPATTTPAGGATTKATTTPATTTKAP